MREISLRVLLLILCLPSGVAIAMQPTTKWYLDEESMADPEHRQLVNLAQRRASSLDESGIRRLVETLLAKEQSPEDFWTLTVLEDRAVPALVAALDDPRFAELEETFSAFYDAARLERLWSFLESRAPATAVPALTKLVQHPHERVRARAALAAGSIGTASAVEATNCALRDVDHHVRSMALVGIHRALMFKRGEPAFTKGIFDAVAAVVDMPSVGGTDAPATLLALERERATTFLLEPERFRADHREISSIARGLAEARVKVPAERATALLAALEQQPQRDAVAYGYSLQLLALSGDPSAAKRIETGMSDEDDFIRDRAAAAYLVLHGIGDAYQIAIQEWGGPDDQHANVPEPVLLYAAAHVMNNEVANGSFGQYFFNSYGKEAALAIKALEAIGATRSAAIAREAAALFGPAGPPADREERQKQLETLDSGAIERLSDAFLKDADPLPVLLARYAVLHKQHFIARRPRTAPAPG